jgi:hypothetical protein
MGAAVARRRAAVGIGHDDEVVGGRGFAIDRLDGAEHHMHAVGRRRLRHGRGRIEGRRHAPRAGIGFRETDEIGALVGGVLDGAYGVGDVVLILAGTVRNRLHNGDAEGHCGLLIALFPHKFRGFLLVAD